ncbi:hypothetical protein FACS189475_09470 [Betaproteobacteria bacterium]|nr:hypothetical protein FACS189475_09470 [Betaproteobacteria bacterium]
MASRPDEFDLAEVFGFPIEVAISLFIVAIAYSLAVHSPELLALVAVWRQRKTMRRRILFVGTVMGATYGFLCVFFMAVCVPVWAFSIFIVPTLREQGYFENSVFLALADFVVAWWWALLPFVVLIPAIFITRYFAARWNRIVEALHD